MKLILASTSPFRKSQLERLGVTFSTESPQVDEDQFKTEIITPNELAKQLAFEKANAVLQSSLTTHDKDFCIIGGDQVLAFQNEILGKPGSFKNACLQLEKLQGKEHQLITSICLLTKDQKIEHTSIAKMQMRSLTSEEIKSYIEKDQPLGCCGSYMLEEAGITLFESIHTEDYTSIIGMPLIFMTTALRELGFQIP